MSHPRAQTTKGPISYSLEFAKQKNLSSFLLMMGLMKRSKEGSTCSAPTLDEKTILLDEYDAYGHEHDHKFPEGGLRAWLVVAGSFVGLMTVFGVMDTMASIQLYITAHQLKDVSLSKVSWIFSLYMFTNLSMGIFSGPVFDVYGAKWVLIVGMVLNCGGLYATAYCQELWQFIVAFGICTGVGSGITLTPLVGVINHWFLKRRGFASGISSCGSVSGIFFPVMLRSLYPSIGYSQSMVIVASMCVAFSVVSLLLVKDRVEIFEDEHLEGTTKRQRLKKTLLGMLNFTNFRELKYLYFVLGMFFNEFSIIIIITYIATYGRARGLTDSSTYLVVTVMNASGIAGKLIPMYLSDKIGRYNTMVLTVVLMLIAQFVVWLPYYNEGAFYFFAALYGFVFSSAYALTPVIISQISHTREFGQRYATAYFIVAFGNLICMPVGSQFINVESVANYNHLIIFSGCTSAVALLFFVASRYMLVGWKVWVYA